MRKWHRWLSLVFGVFALWIAVTGALSQLVPMYLDATQPRPAASAAPADKPAFVCPPDYSCRPKPRDGDARSIVGTLERVGAGSWPPDRVAEALAARDRAACGPVCPPQGLYLTGVGYPQTPFVG